MKSTPTKYNTKLVLIILIGLLLRFGLLIKNRSFWLDDVLILNQAKQTLYSLLSAQYADFGLHGPINYLLLHFVSLLSEEEYFMRVIPTIFSVLMLMPLFKVTRLLFNETNAYIAALFVSFSMYLMEFGLELKNYPLLMFLELWYIYYSLLYIKKQKFINVILIILFGILSLYTDYSVFWIFIVMNISVPLLLLIKTKLKSLKFIITYVCLHFLIIVSYVPYWNKFFQILSHSVEIQFIWRYPPTFKTWLTILKMFTWGRTGLQFVSFENFVQIGFLLILILILLLPFYYVKYEKKYIPNLAYIFIWFLVPICIVYFFVIVVLKGKSVIVDYNLMIVILAWFVLLSLIINVNKIAGKIVVVYFIIINLYAYGFEFQGKSFEGRQDWRKLVQVSGNSLKNISHMYFIGLDTEPYIYYFKKNIGNPTFEISFSVERTRFDDILREYKINSQNSCFVMNLYESDNFRYLFDLELTKRANYSKVSIYKAPQLYMQCIETVKM